MALTETKISNVARPVRYLTESEAGKLSGLSIAFFQKRRWKGGGPPYAKIGRSVRYPEGELLAWMEAHTRRA